MVISPQQLRLHTVTEAISVVFGVPIMLWAGTRQGPLSAPVKAGLIMLGVGAGVVDTYLVWRFWRAQRTALRSG